MSCGALPETLIESELFGYEKGAFTGAEQRKKGRFELADGGTLLLDEIGDVNLATQVKLLRVLQEREFERLGGTESVKVDVRLIAATNKDMEAAVADGTLRQDLLYRLNVFTIFVPPLRERKSDVLLLADHFVEKLSTDHGKQVKRISTPAIDALVGYHWPGNVRELQNVIERAVLVCDGQVIHLHHLPPTLQTAEGIRHRQQPVAWRRRRGIRARPHRGRAEDGARQPGARRAAAAGDAAHRQLQDQAVRHRLAPLSGGGWRVTCR